MSHIFDMPSMRRGCIDAAFWAGIIVGLGIVLLQRSTERLRNTTASRKAACLIASLALTSLLIAFVVPAAIVGKLPSRYEQEHGAVWRWLFLHCVWTSVVASGSVIVVIFLARLVLGVDTAAVAAAIAADLGRRSGPLHVD
ncbi:hypothetical protein psal_cds_1323 [Pandoravirus salinus]|uniref:Uncharacterized protein n=1 Tax=Pandoravirus salinus TaxID=1349410 RepID=S4VYD4_9VIRU|nr:hypothetical protein psal_cds_1323 [Pandoravirus salinus]AGO85704.1 hypothetical protein psal_cds_1323 [Pandoravirus salinus]